MNLKMSPTLTNGKKVKLASVQRPPPFVTIIAASSFALLLGIDASQGASTQNDSESCASIADSAQRLACFDVTQKLITPRVGIPSGEAAETGAAGARATAVIEARGALVALRKLDARVSVGISYRDYPSVLSDAKFAVGQFSRSEAARNLREMDTRLENVLHHYDTALDLWRVRFADPRGRASETFDRFENERLYDRLMTKYAGRVQAAMVNGRSLHYGATLSVIWGAARQELDEADRALK